MEDGSHIESDDSQAVAKPRPTVLFFFLKLFLRATAVGGLVFTLWVIAGSFWFPGWWYGGIWKADLLKEGYLLWGWSYLLDSQRWLLFILVAVGSVAGVYFYFWGKHVTALLDRFAIPTIIACAALLTLDALYLYQPRYEIEARLQEWMAGVVSPQTLEDLLAARPIPHQVVPPVDFHFIDASRVNGMFSEIEPDLVETERTMSASKKQGGSAELEAGPATIKGETAKEKQETSKYERSDTSAERKCVELMNFILKNGSAHYYTTISDFYMMQSLVDAEEAGRVAGQEALKKFDPTMLKPVSPIGEVPVKVTSEQRLAMAKQRAVWDQKFRQEAQGFVIVNGTFHIMRSSNSVSFEEEFSPRPHRTIFRFALPSKYDSDAFQDGCRLRVFGDVVQGTTDLSVLTIHPLAVFNE